MQIINIKLGILFILCIQNSSFVLMLRYSKSVLKEPYLTSTTLIYSEAVKFIISLLLSDWTKLKDVFLTSYLLLPAAAIYYLQNYLVYFALRNLDAPIYTVLTQLKIVTCAFFFVILVGKQITHGQWRALILLVIGVVLVQYDGEQKDAELKRSNFLGVLAGLGIAIASGLASIYFEFVLKKSTSASKYTVFERNIQLAFWSILLGFIALLPDANLVVQNGFFGGYSLFSHILIVWSGVGGILVGVAVKHVGSIVKQFANAAGMIITALCSVYLFDKGLYLHHWLGILLVVLSMFDYQASAGETATSKSSSQTSKRHIQRKKTIDPYEDEFHSLLPFTNKLESTNSVSSLLEDNEPIGRKIKSHLPLPSSPPAIHSR